MLNNLNKAVNELNKAVVGAGGIDSAIEACERMYQASFRSEPVILSLEDFEEEKDGLMDDLIMSLYSAKFGKPNIVCDRSAEFYYELSEDWFYNTYPDFKLESNVEVVYICNYKGEGEGVSLYSLSKNLPVFVDKNTSFYQV